MVRSALALARRSLGPLALLTLVGCSSPPPRRPNPTRPVPERRALEIIARAARKARLQPTEGRDITWHGGSTLHLDVVLEPKKWAVAYLTESDQNAEGATPAPKKDATHAASLLVVDGARVDAGMHVLVLFERDYLYDDQASDERDQTMTTAENSIERDVTDFLVQAKARGWE